MKRFFKNQVLRRRIIARSVEALLLIAGVVGVVWGVGYVSSLRSQACQTQQLIEQRPNDALYFAGLKNALRENENDLTELSTLVPDREELGDLIGSLEALGRRYNVTVLVPEVAEVVVLNEGGILVPPTGPFLDIRMETTAEGEPLDLLRWLYAVEHMPYLVEIPTWHVQTGVVTEPGFVAGAPPGGATNTTTDGPAGLLEARLIVKVTNE